MTSSVLAAFNDQQSALVEAMNSLFDGVYVVDRDRRIVFWNRGAEQITGYPAGEVQGRRCADDILNHIDEDGALVCTGACPLIETFRTGEACERKLYPLTKSGARIPVVTHVASLRDGDGRIVGAIEVFRDVSRDEDFRVLQAKFNALVKKYVSDATMTAIASQLAGPSGDASIRDLTVMYLDVVGFTSFSERHSSEQTIKMLNDVFGICEVLTRRFHGDIDKFIGDAVMATFIDANDAAEASRFILDALTVMNEDRAARGLEPVRVRIGLNSGNVIQGSVGTIDRKDVTVIGDVVNTAARIQALAEPDSVYVSESTLARLRHQADFAFSGESAVKGKAGRVKVFSWRSVRTQAGDGMHEPGVTRTRPIR